MSGNRISMGSVRLHADESAVANRRVPVGTTGALKIQRLRFDQIDDEIRNFWLGLHRSDERLNSPNFHPAFAKAVAAVRDDVEVAVIRSANGIPVGLLPYQRTSEHSASPVGGRMNDYHGLLATPGVKIELESLLHRLDIKRFSFHSLSNSDENFEDFKFDVLPSFSIDLSDGYERYINWAVSTSQTLSRLPQKIRAIQREHGPVRFEFDCNDPAVLEKLIGLKRKKYVATNTFDILSVPWAANLLREIFAREDDEFRGLLSVLWAGDSIAAAHFGMISGEVMQYWFPVYDNAFAKYSPGLQLMANSIQDACDVGIKTIDLSYGQSKFKDLFANEQEDVLYGQVQFNPVLFQIAKQRYSLRKMMKDIPFKTRAKYLLRKVFPGYGQWHFK